jgi:diguanylate cyclase (GGDEF)-like protein
VRGVLAVWLLGLTASLFPTFVAAADASAGPAAAFEIQILGPAGADPSSGVTPQAITSGALDSRFVPFSLREARKAGGVFWLRLRTPQGFTAPTGQAPALLVRKGRHLQVDVFAATTGLPENATPTALPLAATRPTFRGAHDAIFVLPGSLSPGQALYARVEPVGARSEELSFSTGTLSDALAYGASHARMITLAFGGLMAVAIISLLIWFILSDRMLIYYGVLFSMQALYIAFFSGQGFDWPVLSYALPLTSHAWNVPAAISGAAACMFVREIADLRRFWPRVHTAFGWFAAGFLVLAVANVGRHFGLGGLVANLGNLMFLSSAVFTIVVASMAVWRGGRAAAFFLVAWGLLEAFTIAAAIRLLTSEATDSDFLLHTGLPLSMMAAAILIALGVADKLREQRRALSEAERRAATDPLTGVLNRRSLIERLEAACARAQARDLPIALLFIDLDHFKQINDSRGHLAGDACLAAIVAPIQAELRQSDAIGRYGGEEFIVILSGASAKVAHPVAERIRERVASVRVEGFGAPIRLTCSIGIAASDTLGVWGKQLIARADEAVYEAKRSGRNRVQMAEALAA